jgi:metal-dependent amidase/aminoacylase/carboxypeptidase family protein
MAGTPALSKFKDILRGKIICLGTPAEENIGGKYIMLKNNVITH